MPVRREESDVRVGDEHEARDTKPGTDGPVLFCARAERSNRKAYSWE